MFSSHVVYFTGIGSSLMEMKEYENALVFFEQVFDVAIDDDDYNQNDIEFKIYLLPKAFQGPDALLNFSSCLLKLRKFDKALMWLKT